MEFPSREVVNMLREKYPKGTRVVLLEMDDPQAPPIGTKGTVRHVDDAAGIGLTRAQQELDDYADRRQFRYSGCNSKLPIYDRYSYGGLCLLTE